MVIYYEKGDPEQVKRLAKNIEVHKFNGKPIKCKRFFGNYGLNILPYVEAEEYYFIVHCDYKKNKLSKPLVYPGFKAIGVSKLAARSYTEMTEVPCEVIYNPIPIEKVNIKRKTDKIHILCAMRMSGEKGGWRIDKFTEHFDKRKVPYDLTIYTNKPQKIHFTSPNIILKQPKLDLRKEMQEATFIIAPSDHEAFGLTVGESLVLGTPVIVTDIEAYHEIGCIEGENAIYLNLDMSNVEEVIDKVIKGIPEFKYKPPKSNWGKYLDNNSTYDPKEMLQVECLKRLWDLETDKHYARGDKPFMTRERASYLEAKDIVCY